jgi:glycosyltransferase involved in cell wall biosynthesis
MKILILTKRQYTGKDLLDDMYGRMFEIPEELSQLGHEVRGITLSYRRRPSGNFKPKNVPWKSINCIPFSPIGTLVYLYRVYKEVKYHSPDVIWAGSDAWHLITAWIMNKIIGTKYVIDFYDNYESFKMSSLWPQKVLMKYAAQLADGITVVSTTLHNYIQNKYITNTSILVLGNAVDTRKFKSMNQFECRERLKLPKDRVLVGTAGSISENRGIAVLFKGFKIISEQLPNSALVIAGQKDFNTKHFKSLNIIDLGILEYSDIPILLNALDVFVICNTDSSFGRYCYPQKYAEIISCHSNFVAADVGEMRILLKDHANHLFAHNDENDLSKKIQNILLNKNNKPLNPITWRDRAANLDRYLIQQTSNN